MKILPYLSLVLLFVSCSSPNLKENAALLNGYWEIEKVVLLDGSTKEFSVNTSLDYIETKGLEGVRKKVSPKLDGTFTTFPQNEQFTLFIVEGAIVLKYTTPYDTWTEKIIKLSKDILITENNEKKKYHYKRFTSILEN